MEYSHKPSFASPSIKRYEEKRRHFSEQIKQFQILLFGAIVGIILTIIAMKNGWLSNFPNSVGIITILCGVGLAIYGGYQWHAKQKEFTEKVLKPAIQHIIENSGRNWKYLPKGHVDKHFINRTLLFGSSPTSLNGEFILNGNHNDVSFSLIEVTCYKGSGKHRKTMFDGTIIQIEKQHNLNGSIAVLPDTAQKISGLNIGKKLQGWNAHNGMKMVYFKDTTFEKKYVVYADNETQTRQFLGHEKLKLFKELNPRFNNQLFVSFQPNLLTIGIGGLALLDLNSKTSLSDSRTSEGIERDFQMIEEIIDWFG